MSPGSPRGRRPRPPPKELRPRPLLPEARPPPRPRSSGLADPPATARAPALWSSVPFGGGSWDNLFLPGVAAGGGTGRAPAALPSAPSLPPSPLSQPLQDELLLSRLGSLTGRGRRRGGGEGRGEGPGKLCHPPKFWAQSQNPGVKVNFLPRSPFPSGRKRKRKEGNSGGGKRSWFHGPGGSSLLPSRLPGLLGERGPVLLLPSRKGLRESRVGSPGGRGLRKLWAGNRAGRGG